jgi:hypothetical protein
VVDQRITATAFAELQTSLGDRLRLVVVCHPDDAATVQQAIRQLSPGLPVPQLETDPNIAPGNVSLRKQDS